MRHLIPMTMLAALLLAPLALAQEEKPTRPDDAAWVEDCPPDMMCAAGAGNETPEEPTYGDCGAEVCAYDEPTRGPADGSCEYCRGDGAIGPEDCKECMTPPPGGNGTCMDGADANESCDDGLQYFGGSPNPPATDADKAPYSGPAEGDAPTEEAAAKTVPYAGLAVVAVALVAALLLTRRS